MRIRILDEAFEGMFKMAREYKDKAVKFERELQQLKLDQKALAAKHCAEDARTIAEYERKFQERNNELYHIAIALRDDTIKELEKELQAER